MNVMQICSGVEIDGAVMHCLLLSRALARRGHRVTLVCRAAAWIGTQVGDDPIEVIHSDLSRWPSEVGRLAAAARARRIDVLHTHMSRAHFFGVLLRWRSGVPCVATAHNQHLQLHWVWNDAVIANSDATRRYQRRRNLVRAARIVTIHGFVDADRIAAAAPARARVRRELGLAPAAPVVGTIGTVIPRKGLRHLLLGWPAVLAARPEARLLIVGDEPGAHASELRRLASELGIAGSIIWTGRRTDVAEILAALDLFVLASIAEPLGLVLVEAMAAALPVVATAVGGVPEIVLPDRTGVLVPRADGAALGAALGGLLGDPERCRRFGAAGRARVREQFVADTLVPRVEAVLARVAARRR